MHCIARRVYNHEFSMLHNAFRKKQVVHGMLVLMLKLVLNMMLVLQQHACASETLSQFE